MLDRTTLIDVVEEIAKPSSWSLQREPAAECTRPSEPAAVGRRPRSMLPASNAGLRA